MRGRRRLSVCLALGVLGAISATPTFGSARPERRFYVVVNPENPVDELDRALVARLFLGKVSRWPDGEIVQPVDLPHGSALRATFAEKVLGRSAAAVRAYWQQAIFSGRDLPPPELPSEDKVIKYVLTNEGAVGYVSRDTHLRGAKVVTIK